MADRAGFEDVWKDEGGVTFRYTALTPLGGLGAGVATVQQAQAELPAAAAEEVDINDFIALDDIAVEDAKPNGSAAAAADIRTEEEEEEEGDIVEEFISLSDLAATPAPAIPSTAAAPGPLDQVPWLPALRGISSQSLRLHQEVVEFCRYLQPSPEESAQRHAAIARIQDVVRAIWPEAELQVFGSFATGLYLPTSDVDAVIMNSGCADIPAGLKALATSLARKNLAKNMQVIAKARVPIVKFEEAESGYNFDISFDLANGPEAAANVRAMMDALPPMRPLLMVLKVFLQQRDLNEVYSGGLGSYALLVMVAAFLMLHPSRRPRSGSARGAGGAPAGRLGRGGSGAPGSGDIEGNLGVLLLDFFRLFGRSLNHFEVGVSCRRGGAFFSKRSKGFYQDDRPFLLAVEDPNDPENDLGKNSYNIARVRMAFDFAYCQLVAPCDPGESLLKRIIRLDPVLFLRAPPAHVPDPPSPGPASKKQRRKERAEQRQVERAVEEAAAQGKSSKRKRRQEAEEMEAEAAAARQVGREKSGSKQKQKRRRHRERSLSDDDLGGPPSGASGGRWELEEEAQGQQQEDAGGWEEPEEEEQLQHRGSAKHRRTHGHGSKHHHHHHHHSSHTKQRREQQQQQRSGAGERSGGRGSGHSGGRGGSGRGSTRWGGKQQRHIRFD